VQLKLCPKCRRPYLANKEYCPNCPEPYAWNQESYANLGCLLLMILPLVLMIFFWLFLMMGALFR
jgi:hypothetical protein